MDPLPAQPPQTASTGSRAMDAMNFVTDTGLGDAIASLRAGDQAMQQQAQQQFQPQAQQPQQYQPPQTQPIPQAPAVQSSLVDVPNAPVPQAAPAAPAMSMAERMAQGGNPNVVPPAVPTDAAPSADPDAPAGNDPKAGHRWAQLRGEVNQLKSTLEMTNREKAENAVKIKELADALEAQKDAAVKAEEALGRVKLEASPRFQEKYTKGFNEITKRVATTLETYAAMDPDEAKDTAERLLQLTPQQLAQEVRNLDSYVGGSVLSIATEAHQLNQQRQSELESWRAAQANDLSDQMRRELVADSQERRSLAEEAIQHARDTQGVYLFNTEDPDIAPIAMQTIEGFKTFAQSADANDLMRYAASGFALPAYVEQLRSVLQQNAELQRTVDSMSRMGSIPMDGSTPVPQAPTNPFANGTSSLGTATDLAGDMLRQFQIPRGR